MQIQIAPCCKHGDDERFRIETPEAPADSKTSSSSSVAAAAADHIKINGVFFVKANPCYKEGDDVDDIYGADARRINTGANPLHNR